jgi:hypothetical protein
MVEADIDAVRTNVEAPLARFSQSFTAQDSTLLVRESERLDDTMARINQRVLTCHAGNFISTALCIDLWQFVALTANVA